MGSSAIAISLPFSCVLGLLASMTASTMGTQLKINEIKPKSYVNHFYRATVCVFLNSISYFIKKILVSFITIK